MTLVAIYYHHGLPLPTVCDVGSESKFIECCELIPTDWAHLMNQETGEILYTWRKKDVIHSNPINIYTTNS